VVSRVDIQTPRSKNFTDEKFLQDWLMRKVKTFMLLASIAAAGGAVSPAQAQSSYPDRAVRIVLPFAAGGVADITSRIVAEALSQQLGQRFIVENAPGAGGIAAARAVTSAAPDGYTLALITNGTAISVPLFNNLPFDPLKDFVPISSLGYFDFVVGTNVNSPYKTIADIVKAAQAAPGKLNVGTINIGSSQNLAAELLKSAANINFTIVPYRATPEVLVGLLRDDVQVMIDNYAAMKASLSDKKIVAVATTGNKRSPAQPDVPSVEEGGVKDYEVISWNALFAPAGTPPEVVAKLNAALRKVLEDQSVKQRALDLGIETKASTPEEIAGKLKGDIEKWGKVIARANIPKQ
jgi:tripartite-type tricarboxylate transporter receptor subunit TctC